MKNIYNLIAILPLMLIGITVYGQDVKPNSKEQKAKVLFFEVHPDVETTENVFETNGDNLAKWNDVVDTYADDESVDLSYILTLVEGMTAKIENQ